MKQHDDYLATSVWHGKIITDPYQVIAEFFTCNTIDSYRKTIKSTLIAACTNKIYNKSDPGDLLFVFKMIESIINSAFIIDQEKKKSPFTIEATEVFRKSLYCGRHTHVTEWDYFPRSLSMKEYINPYLVFKFFFKFQSPKKWKQELHNLLQYVLVKMSCHEGGATADTLSIYFYLTKLIEAAHLVDVREITHVGGHIKAT